MNDPMIVGYLLYVLSMAILGGVVGVALGCLIVWRWMTPR